MKSIITLAIASALAFALTGCVVGFRSNITQIKHYNKATTEGAIKDASSYDNGSPAVNADKSFSDLLNGSGNGNGAGQDRSSTTPAE